MLPRDKVRDYTKEHELLEMSDDGKTVLCTRCHKVLEHRDEGMPDYSVFMGGVFIKQNLPCELPPKNPKR